MRLNILKIQALGYALIIGRPAYAAGKRGLAYSDPNLANMFTPYSSVTWGYNWGYPAGNLNGIFEYSPMLWGDPTGNPSYISEWSAAVQSSINNGSRHILCFNEPDINNIAPAEAASAYMNFMQPWASQVALGAPAVTNGGPPTGLTWLDQFLGNCTQCTIDFVPFHWYGEASQITYFASYVQQAYAASGNKPLWITEFEGEGADADQVAFIETVVPWLDSLSYVERYAYFGVFEDYLINSDGTALSDIGMAYATVSNVNSTTPTSPV